MGLTQTKEVARDVVSPLEITEEKNGKCIWQGWDVGSGGCRVTVVDGCRNLYMDWKERVRCDSCWDGEGLLLITSDGTEVAFDNTEEWEEPSSASCSDNYCVHTAVLAGAMGILTVAGEHEARVCDDRLSEVTSQPPELHNIEPPIAAEGEWVNVVGNLFGGCSAKHVHVLCGLDSSGTGPCLATDVIRVNHKVVRFKVPSGVQSVCPIIIACPFGRSRNKSVLEVRQPELQASLVLKSIEAPYDDMGCYTICGAGFTEDITVSVNGHVLPKESWELRSDEHITAEADLSDLDGVLTAAVWNDSQTASVVSTVAPSQSACTAALPCTLQTWCLAPDKVTCNGVPMRHFVRCLYRIGALARYKMHLGTPSCESVIPESIKLTLEDYRALCKAQELTEQYYFCKTQRGGTGVAVLFKSLGNMLWKAAESFGLPELVQGGYKEGDVLFYDLQSRTALGDVELRDASASAFFRLQKTYDRFSHSGVFIRKKSRPAIFHGLRTRVKDLTVPAAFAYMPKREVDLRKVFFRFRYLPETMQEKMDMWYREAVCRRAKQGQLILNDCADLWDIIKVVRSIPGRQSQALSVVGDPGVLGRGDTVRIMCSAFTASILLESFLEMETKLHSIAAQEEDLSTRNLYLSVTVHPSLVIDTLSLPPKLLHKWNVWRDTLSSPPLLLAISASDVHSSFRALRALQLCDDDLIKNLS
eukprot:TRINITY_DN3793_c0_g1_i1.p1 TRINITY_DN3793_c0_g1~~TRINITY_DN3793_c0_g1_i1.p1  ORF type:complete len:701 (+),score=150.15 TRINITY_DN3793_c0_g1_i1:4324-6426(+)